MIIYKKLNFPPIPKDLLNFELNLHKTVDDSGYGFSYHKNGRKIYPCQVKKFKFDHEPLNQWFRQHALDFTNNIKFLLVQEPKNSNSATHIVHSDIKRKMALNYVIDTGGDNVITTWYREKEKDLYRSKESGGMLCDSGFVNYDDLDIIESVKFEKESWYAFDGEILHDVDNIVSERKSLSINFRQKQFLE